MPLCLWLCLSDSIPIWLYASNSLTFPSLTLCLSDFATPLLSDCNETVETGADGGNVCVFQWRVTLFRCDSWADVWPGWDLTPSYLQIGMSSSLIGIERRESKGILFHSYPSTGIDTRGKMAHTRVYWAVVYLSSSELWGVNSKGF